MSTRDTHRQGEEIAKAPSAMVDEELQSAKYTMSGGGPHSVTFNELGLEDMANPDYRIMVQGEFASNNVHIDESTISETGFDIVNGADTEIAHLFIHGKIASRKDF